MSKYNLFKVAVALKDFKDAINEHISLPQSQINTIKIISMDVRMELTVGAGEVIVARVNLYEGSDIASISESIVEQIKNAPKEPPEAKPPEAKPPTRLNRVGPPPMEPPESKPKSKPEPTSEEPVQGEQEAEDKILTEQEIIDKLLSIADSDEKDKLKGKIADFAKKYVGKLNVIILNKAIKNYDLSELVNK